MFYFHPSFLQTGMVLKTGNIKDLGRNFQCTACQQLSFKLDSGAEKSL